MVKGGYSLSSRRTKNSQLKRQKSVAIHLSLTLMRVKLVTITFDNSRFGKTWETELDKNICVNKIEDWEGILPILVNGNKYILSKSSRFNQSISFFVVENLFVKFTRALQGDPYKHFIKGESGQLCFLVHSNHDQYMSWIFKWDHMILSSEENFDSFLIWKLLNWHEISSLQVV